MSDYDDFMVCVCLFLPSGLEDSSAVHGHIQEEAAGMNVCRHYRLFSGVMVIMEINN